MFFMQINFNFFYYFYRLWNISLKAYSLEKEPPKENNFSRLNMIDIDLDSDPGKIQYMLRMKRIFFTSLILIFFSKNFLWIDNNWFNTWLVFINLKWRFFYSWVLIHVLQLFSWMLEMGSLWLQSYNLL